MNSSWVEAENVAMNQLNSGQGVIRRAGTRMKDEIDRRSVDSMKDGRLQAINVGGCSREGGAEQASTDNVERNHRGYRGGALRVSEQ